MFNTKFSIKISILSKTVRLNSLGIILLKINKLYCDFFNLKFNFAFLLVLKRFLSTYNTLNYRISNVNCFLFKLYVPKFVKI